MKCYEILLNIDGPQRMNSRDCERDCRSAPVSVCMIFVAWSQFG